MIRFYKNTKISSLVNEANEFLKDPLFFASRMFVKLPQRVAAGRHDYGVMFAGLQHRAATTSLLFSLAQGNDSQSTGEAHRATNTAMGNAMFSVRAFGLGRGAQVGD